MKLNLGLLAGLSPNWMQRHLANRAQCKRLSPRLSCFLFNDPVNFELLPVSEQSRTCTRGVSSN